jgi:CDP-glycerol glycerophosphotransferase (TagB/SpsB family)
MKTPNSIYKIAFIGWNPFQFIHIRLLASKILNSVFILEKRSNNIGKFSDEILKNTDVPILIWDKKDMIKLDGVFDVIVTQTLFADIYKFQKTKIAMLQYGYAKEPHNYGAWRALADLCLVYGEYAAKKISHFCPVEIVGNPRYDVWYDEEFHKNAHLTFKHLLKHKKTILYMPTWGELSSIDDYLLPIVGLASNFNVLIKIHHNTDLLEKKRIKSINSDQVHLFGANADLLKLLSVADYVISDYSGAIFDAIYCDKPVILIDKAEEILLKNTKKIDAYSLEFSMRSKLGIRVKTPQEILPSLQYLQDNENEVLSKVMPLKNTLFADNDNAVQKAADAIYALIEGKYKPSQMHEYIRNALKVAAQKQIYQMFKILYENIIKIFSAIAKYPIGMKNIAAYHLANIYLKKRNQKSALNILLRAQMNYYSDRRVLLKISEIYKNDRQIAKAYYYILIAEISYPVYGAIRRLAFEADHKMINSARDTLEKVLSFNISDLVRFLSIVNRVSCFFLEYGSRLNLIRDEARKYIKDSISANKKDFNQNIRFLLSNRFIADAIFYIDNKAHPRLNQETNLWYKKVKNNIIIDDATDIMHWLDIAMANEDQNVFKGVKNGKLFDLTTADMDENCIELFIPSVFFTNPSKEKQPFSMVADFFKIIIKTIYHTKDIIVLPRHQYNWRNVNRKTKACKAISYHTANDTDDSLWLHVQESALANRCSVDVRGFAGYSSIAKNFAKIKEQTKDISDVDIKKNYKNLYDTYVVKNISKYENNNRLHLNFVEEYVFVGLQVLTDAAADLVYVDSLNLLKMVAGYYKNSKTKVVVKRHPFCNSLSVQLLLEGLNKNGDIIVSNASIHDLISNAKAVFVANSGVGLEALMHMKPVVTTGESNYSYAVFAMAKSEEELENILKQDNFTVDKNKIMRFLYYYSNLYTYSTADIEKFIRNWLNNKRS